MKDSHLPLETQVQRTKGIRCKGKRKSSFYNRKNYNLLVYGPGKMQSPAHPLIHVLKYAFYFKREK